MRACLNQLGRRSTWYFECRNFKLCSSVPVSHRKQHVLSREILCQVSWLAKCPLTGCPFSQCEVCRGRIGIHFLQCHKVIPQKAHLQSNIAYTTLFPLVAATDTLQSVARWCYREASVDLQHQVRHSSVVRRHWLEPVHTVVLQRLLPPFLLAGIYSEEIWRVPYRHIQLNFTNIWNCWFKFLWLVCLAFPSLAIAYPICHSVP